MPSAVVKRFEGRELPGWCAEMRGIYSTEDGGATWVKHLDSGSDPFVQMVFVDRSRGWVLTFTGNVYTYSEDAL